MKKAILVATIGAMTLGVNAGDWGKAPVDKTPIVECVDIGGQVSVGYKSDYIFYGVQQAGDTVWTDVNYAFDGLAVPITIGATYLNAINGGGVAGLAGIAGAISDELDLYARAALGTFAGFDVSLGYTHYLFPEARGLFGPRTTRAAGFGGYGELGLNVTRDLGFATLLFEANRAFGGSGSTRGGDGYYYQLGLEKGFGITDNISLVLGAGVGYSDNYFQAPGGGGPGLGIIPTPGATNSDSGWNHYYVTASLPIVLNCRTTLTPYVGFNGAPDTWIADGMNPLQVGAAQSDVLHGGVTLSVTF